MSETLDRAEEELLAELQDTEALGELRPVDHLPGHQTRETEEDRLTINATHWLRKIAGASRRLDTLNLPTAGACDRIDEIELRVVAAAMETASRRYEAFVAARAERLRSKR